MRTMFDLDGFLDDCVANVAESSAPLAVRDVLRRALGDAGAVADRFRPERGGITLLYHSPAVTVIDVVWAPGMRIFPHDHRMWAVIGVYAGREDNTFFRRDGGTLRETRTTTLGQGEVAVLGTETIHGVANPLSTTTGAIHVYGGDFVNQPRSQWRPPALAEEPYDSAVVAATFEEANARAGL